MLFSTPIAASERKPSRKAAPKTKNLPMNPAVGGMPASERKKMMNSAATYGARFTSPA